jgi:hypothetical protein
METSTGYNYLQILAPKSKIRHMHMLSIPVFADGTRYRIMGHGDTPGPGLTTVDPGDFHSVAGLEGV